MARVSEFLWLAEMAVWNPLIGVPALLIVPLALFGIVRALRRREWAVLRVAGWMTLLPIALTLLMLVAATFEKRGHGVFGAVLFLLDLCACFGLPFCFRKFWSVSLPIAALQTWIAFCALIVSAMEVSGNWL